MIPKAFRDQLGLRAGAVEVTTDGAALRVEAIAEGELIDEAGRLVIATGGGVLTDEMVRDALEAGRR